MTEAEKKLAASLGLTPEGLARLQKQIAKENQLTETELYVAQRFSMTAEQYLRRRDPPAMTDQELRTEQARVLRRAATASPFSVEDRTRLLADADALEAVPFDASEAGR
jgi:hypothetical protein